MAFDREFQRQISDRPSNLILCLVVSILLHLLLLAEAKNWLSAFLPQPKRETSEPIPIEFVDVPPKETPPPKTQRRAANNSVAGGQARRDRPVSAATPVQPQAPTRQAASTAMLTRSRQQTLPKRTAAVPTVRPQPKPQEEPAPTPTTSKSQPTPQLSRAIPTTPKRQEPAPTPTISQPQPTPQIRPTPTISKPPQAPVAVAPAIQPLPTIKQPRSTQQNNQPPKPAPTTRTAAKTSSPASGSASKLGGPMALSSRDLGGNLPNSNRSNRGTAGIDARRDVDMGAYYQQLQQRVRQQWIPGITQSSYQTVVYFIVSRSGQIRGLRVVRPSGSNAVDNAALGAVQRAAPFSPLPTGYSGNSVNIVFTFNINLSGQLELRAR